MYNRKCSLLTEILQTIDVKYKKAFESGIELERNGSIMLLIELYQDVKSAITLQKILNT